MSLIATYVSTVVFGFSKSLNTYRKIVDGNFRKEIFETELRLALTLPLAFGAGTTLGADSQEIKMRDRATGELQSYIKSGACYQDYLVLKIDAQEARRIEIVGVISVLGYLEVQYKFDPAACATVDPVASSLADTKTGRVKVPMFFVVDQTKFPSGPLAAAITEAYSTNLTTVSLSSQTNGAICNAGQYDLANCKTSHEKQCELYHIQDDQGNEISKHFDPVTKACMPQETWTRD